MDPCLLAKKIDHTILRPDSTIEDVKKYAEEALRYGFGSLYVPPWLISKAYELISGSDVKLGTVAAFPHGTSTTDTKLSEINSLTQLGVDCIDFVINIGAAKQGLWDYLKDELEAIAKECKGVILKAIIEVGYFTEDEIMKISEIIVDAGIPYIKTCTGYGPRGVTIEDVRIIRQVVGEKAKIKAAGGIRSYDYALKLLESGADVIGTSKGVIIIQEAIESEQ